MRAASGGAEVEVESALGALAEEEVAGLVLDEDAGFPAFDAGAADAEVFGKAFLGESHGFAAGEDFAAGEESVFAAVGIVGGDAEGIEVAGAEHAEAAMAALQGGRGDAEGFAAEILFGFALDQGEGIVRSVAGGAEVGSGRLHGKEAEDRRFRGQRFGRGRFD